MRIPALTMCLILAAGAFLSAGPGDARADVTNVPAATQTRSATLPQQTLPAQPATRDEERNYARREAESPAAVTQYSGGFLVGVLVLVVLVVLIVYLVNRT